MSVEALAVGLMRKLLPNLRINRHAGLAGSLAYTLVVSGGEAWKHRRTEIIEQGIAERNSVFSVPLCLTYCRTTFSIGFIAVHWRFLLHLELPGFQQHERASLLAGDPVGSQRLGQLRRFGAGVKDNAARFEGDDLSGETGGHGWVDVKCQRIDVAVDLAQRRCYGNAVDLIKRRMDRNRVVSQLPQLLECLIGVASRFVAGAEDSDRLGGCGLVGLGLYLLFSYSV